MVRSNDSIVNKVKLFSRKLPSSMILFSVLCVLSLVTGIASVALINHSGLTRLVTLESVIASGMLTGILVVLLPTMLTVVLVKSVKRYVRIKYMIFISLLGAAVYALFIILASAIFAIFHDFTFATGIVLVGDASIYGWWFFISKVLFGDKKKAMLYPLAQPVLNILIYIFASKFIFTFAAPLTVLLVKLAGGIFIFLAISYLILYIFDTPVKRNIGIGGIETFSQIVQNWLFDVNVLVAKPLTGEKNFGIKSNVEINTVVFKTKESKPKIKAILFIPELHYGPVGSIGGSNFPFLLEKYTLWKYKVPAFVMHSAVNEDSNPVSSLQIDELKRALDRSIAKCDKLTGGKTNLSYTTSSYKKANISLISINDVNIVTFSRAPHVTEDIEPASAAIFKGLLERKGHSILLDAHNSRYESATFQELQGVRFNSEYMNEYVHAIKHIGKPEHTTTKVKIGVSNINASDWLKDKTDIAPGNMNIVVFYFNGFKRAIIQFNANNMLPSLRNAILSHIKQKYGIDAELYTTDTHYVNALDKTASNVLGRETKLGELIPMMDKGVAEAMANAEYVDVYHKQDHLKNFRIWGPDVREKVDATMTSVVGISRIIVPIIVAAGFVIASWIISVI